MSRLSPEFLSRSVEALFHSPTEAAAGRPGTVGIELELIPVSPPAGCPGPDSDVLLDRIAAEVPAAGSFTFEPGGQFEYSGPACATLAEAVDDAEQTLERVAAAAREVDLELRTRGLAPWFGPDDVGLRRPKPRYREMDRYMTRRGPWGRWMMRLSASLQVNLDFGTPEEAPGRWATANALTPLLTAVFANSPTVLPDGTSVVDGRWWIWRQLDPSRTRRLGERGAIGPGADGAGILPWTEYLKFALTARVVFDADMRPVVVDGEEAPRFTDWWLAGGEDDGPTEDDWYAHLGTLFPDVRPRRWMEIRAVDVPERPWWPVPPTLLSALLYDDRAREGADEVLGGLAASAPRAELSERAIREGLADAELRAVALELFGLAEGAMDRFPAGWFGDRARTATAEFRERYVETGRMQADEARESGEVTRLVS